MISRYFLNNIIVSLQKNQASSSRSRPSLSRQKALLCKLASSSANPVQYNHTLQPPENLPRAITFQYQRRSPYLLEFVTQCLIHYTTPWFLSFKVTVAAKPSSLLPFDRNRYYARIGSNNA